MSSSLSICRTLNLREKSFPVPRSSETATVWSVATSVSEWWFTELLGCAVAIFSSGSSRERERVGFHRAPRDEPRVHGAHHAVLLRALCGLGSVPSVKCMGSSGLGSFPQPQTGGTRNRQSFRLKAGLRTRKSGLVSLRKKFLPTKFSYPKFRGSGPGSSTRSMPTARHRPAQLNHFPD